MQKMNFVRGVARFGYILMNLLKVLSVIGAICILLCVLFLSAVPQDLIDVNVDIGTEIRLDLKKISERADADWDLFRENMEDSLDEIEDEVSAQMPDFENTITMDGEDLFINGSTSLMRFDLHTVVLALFPTFIELILGFLLYHFLSKVFRTLRDSATPFCNEIGKFLKRAGIMFWVLAVLPTLCTGLLELLTKTARIIDTSIDLSMILLGFVLWALAAIFDYGVFLQKRQAVPEGPGPVSFEDQNSVPPAPPKDTETPEAPKPSDETDHHPDAF